MYEMFHDGKAAISHLRHFHLDFHYDCPASDVEHSLKEDAVKKLTPNPQTQKLFQNLSRTFDLNYKNFNELKIFVNLWKNAEKNITVWIFLESSMFWLTEHKRQKRFERKVFLKFNDLTN